MLDLRANRIVALVDFLKWTASLDSAWVHQIEFPYTGIRLSPVLSDLFGLAKDEAGWMLVMRREEAPWLAHIPLHSAYAGFGGGLVLILDQFEVLDVPVGRLAIDIFIPDLELRRQLAEQTLLGVGLVNGDGVQQVSRVNSIVPLYTKDRYDIARRAATRNDGSLFERH